MKVCRLQVSEYEDKEEQQYKEFRDTGLFFNRDGKCRVQIKGKYYFLEGRIKNNCRVIKYNQKEYMYYRALWETFNGEIPKGYVIVTQTRCNDSLAMLKMVTKSASMSNACKKRTKQVIDTKTGIVYRSAKDCAKRLYLGATTVYDICNKKRKMKGYSLRWYMVE